ncbi:hypothetical protein JQM66_01270 [Oscillibacter valericigenes]|uniref:hypothetical protein n=1 Tax=Oscillibacter valericigenes TaxID=351091 RepID=UPI001F2A7739|nr:hypothetical protein [Oscillibacter valericigenes]MCF2663191.1 hypothetical protein [Oscillibacter valericigenes]
MADSTDIRLSARASQVAERFKTEGWFDSANEAAIFAAAYILNTQFDSFDPLAYVVPDSNGSNYAYTSFDKDGTWDILLRTLYHTDMPRTCLRSLMVYGLEYIGNQIDESGKLSLVDYL